MSRALKVIKSFNEELSTEKKIQIIKKKDQILTLKKPVRWKGEEFRQIMTNGIEKKQGKYTLMGTRFDTESADSLEKLTDLIDWKDYEARRSFSK